MKNPSKSNKYIIPCWAEQFLKTRYSKNLLKDQRKAIEDFINKNNLHDVSWRFSELASFCCQNSITGDDPCDCCTGVAFNN